MNRVTQTDKSRRIRRVHTRNSHIPSVNFMISAESFIYNRGVPIAVFLVTKTSTLLPRSVLTQKRIFGHGCYMCFLSHGDIPRGVCVRTEHVGVHL